MDWQQQQSVDDNPSLYPAWDVWLEELEEAVLVLGSQRESSSRGLQSELKAIPLSDEPGSLDGLPLPLKYWASQVLSAGRCPWLILQSSRNLGLVDWKGQDIC